MSSQVSLQKLFEVVEKNISQDRSSLEGRILTIVDSAFADKEQREAVKSLVRQAIWEGWGDYSLSVFSQYAEKNGEEFPPSKDYAKKFNVQDVSWFN